LLRGTTLGVPQKQKQCAREGNKLRRGADLSTKIAAGILGVVAEQGAMHSLMFRANAVLTFGITLLAALCCLASFSDNLHYTSPSVDLQVCVSITVLT
jgi:hypothetical protein